MTGPPADWIMYALSPDFYPVQVHEARYGVYEGGPWVLIAGLRNPRVECAAFGCDVPCPRFWKRVSEEGTVIEVTVGDERRDVFAAVGPDPASLVDEFVGFIDASDEYRTGAAELRRELRGLRERDG